MWTIWAQIQNPTSCAGAVVVTIRHTMNQQSRQVMAQRLLYRVSDGRSCFKDEGVFMIAASPAIRQAGTIRPASYVSPWRLAARCNTIEAAERVLLELCGQGVEAYVTLIGGLSVIADSGGSESESGN